MNKILKKCKIKYLYGSKIKILKLEILQILFINLFKIKKNLFIYNLNGIKPEKCQILILVIN
jgi:hypothetical protein